MKHEKEIQKFLDGHINELHFHLDTEEEYEEHSEIVDYGNFYRFMDQCPSVYATTSDNEKYGSDRLKSRKLFPYIAAVERCLAAGIRLQEFDPALVPLIPIVEYKLVPTGNVFYFDPMLTQEQREQMQKERITQERKKKARWISKKKIIKTKESCDEET